MNFLYSIYFALPGFHNWGLAGKMINRVTIFLLKRIFDFFVPGYLINTKNKQGTGINLSPRDETYIVSLTSFPARINDIWITIETILRQSFKPDKIILWLAEEQFPDKKLPDSLTNLVDRGLTILYCKDLRSHKKYYYSFIQFPEANIITMDDDVYYPRDTLKNLIELHSKNKNLVAANRAHKITFSKGKMNKYNQWKHNVPVRLPSHLLVPTGIGGTLYPPGVLTKDTLNEDLIRELCFYADDIWLKVMELKSNVMVVTNNRFNKSFVSVKATQENKLTSINIYSKGNDSYFKNTLEYFNINILDYLD
jgi:hypothetical protein